MGVRTVTINAQGFYGGAAPSGALVNVNDDLSNAGRLTKDVAIALGSATSWEILETDVTVEQGTFGPYWGIYAAMNVDNAYGEDLIGAQFVDALLSHGWTEVDLRQVQSESYIKPTKTAPTPKPKQTNTTVTVMPNNTQQPTTTAGQSFVDLDPNSPTYLMTCTVNANGTWTCTDSSSETLTGAPTPQSKGFADLLKGEATTLGISTGVLLAIGVLAFAIINKD